MGKWHCTFDELISNHTAGQIKLLVCGTAEWEEFLAARAKEYETSQPETEPVETKKPKKIDFSKMSGADYMRYCDGKGL